MKLKLTYIPWKDSSCIPYPHYDLHTNEGNPENIACIRTDKEGAKLIRKWIQLHNKKELFKEQSLEYLKIIRDAMESKVYK